MFKILQVAALLGLSIALNACEVKFDANIRSGTIDDDYVAEPLSDMSRKYEHALQTSNAFINRMKSGDQDSIYENLFSSDLRNIVSQQDFQKVIRQIHNEKGKIVRYKEMQWGFISGKEEGRNFIGSVKIVEHEKGMMKYLIVFDDDNKFDEIVGFRFKERDGVSIPGQF